MAIMNELYNDMDAGGSKTSKSSGIWSGQGRER